MPSLSESVITNVQENIISTYLRQKGFVQPGKKKGQSLKHWVDDLLKEEKINMEDFEEFLFEELFWGKRKTMRMYKIEKTKDYKFQSDWEKFLGKYFGLDSIDFSDILNTIPSKKEFEKIAAVRFEADQNEELIKLRILFVFYIEIDRKRKLESSTAYVPVEIDFRKKTLLIKAWTRQYVAFEDYKAEKLMQHVMELLEDHFKVVIKPYGLIHKKVLFNMSRSLIHEAYSNVPAYSEIDDMKGPIKDFIKAAYSKLSLRNISEDDNGERFLPKEVLDLEGAARNVLENLVISDYFFSRSYQEIWETGMEAVISRIKFNDKEEVFTSINAENTEMPVFCTKTFMSLINRMEETERIETLWVAMNRENEQKGHLNLKFDASNQDYLGILITNYGIRFHEADLNSALELYGKYEQEAAQKDTGKSKMAVGQ